VIADDELRTAKVMLHQTLVDFPLPPLAICEVDLEWYHAVAQQQFFTSKILPQHTINSGLIKDCDIPPTQFYELETPVYEDLSLLLSSPGKATKNFPSPQGPCCGTKGDLFQVVCNERPLLDIRTEC
jgi:hypothetical protein